MKTTKKKREFYTRLIAGIICGAMVLVIVVPIILGA